MLYSVFLVMLILGIILFIVSLTLTFTLRIPDAIDDLTGRKTKRQIKNLRSLNQGTGSLVVAPTTDIYRAMLFESTGETVNAEEISEVISGYKISSVASRVLNEEDRDLPAPSDTLETESDEPEPTKVLVDEVRKVKTNRLDIEVDEGDDVEEIEELTPELTENKVQETQEEESTGWLGEEEIEQPTGMLDSEKFILEEQSSVVQVEVKEVEDYPEESLEVTPEDDDNIDFESEESAQQVEGLNESKVEEVNEDEEDEDEPATSSLEEADVDEIEDTEDESETGLLDEEDSSTGVLEDDLGRRIIRIIYEETSVDINTK